MSNAVVLRVPARCIGRGAVGFLLCGVFKTRSTGAKEKLKNVRGRIGPLGTSRRGALETHAIELLAALHVVRALGVLDEQLG